MQLMENLPSVKKAVVKGLCVECAVRHHNFKEMLAHGKEDEHFSESPLPAAWIDGRRYRLLTPLGAQNAVCYECSARVPVVFLPVTE